MSDPKWLELARKELGTKEWPGSSTNPTVHEYYHDAVNFGQPDSVPWCAAFAGAMIRRAGLEPWGNLMARGALNWGTKLSKPIPGAIVVFARGRPPSGHVAFVEKARGNQLVVIGGNQSDAVTRAARSTNGVIGYRWPPGAPLPGAMKKAFKPTMEAPVMAEKTAQDIMDGAKKLFSDADTVMSASGARKMAKDAAGLIFYLAKLHLPPAERKGIKFGPIGTVVKPKAKKALKPRKK